MSDKLKILWVGEASYLDTGYSKYAREVLNRLYNTGKYEIAEFASYGHYTDERAASIPWKFYGNLPEPYEVEVYKSFKGNEFGEWRFEEVLLDFRPDVVWDIRDVYMSDFAAKSPYRRFFHWVVMPTVDSAPQQEQWLSTYLSANSVFAYSEFGRDTLQKETNNKINVIDICSPGADTNTFKPILDKKKLRDSLGLMEDVKIVGTVMRNQKRKLFPDLIEGFKIFIEKYPSTSQDAFLYLHTSYPDLGWDIPYLLRESGISHRILFSYICKSCGAVFPSFFQDARMGCIKCGKPSAVLPSYQDGVTEQQLSLIMNLFDVYVQYANCEGAGMPQIEAASCGVPTMAVDYSAMASIVRNVKGTPIKVERFFKESESNAFRALPDNADLAAKLSTFFALNKTMRLKKGRDALMGARKHYTWDYCAKKWENFFDTMELKREPWNSPPRIKEPVRTLPRNLTSDEFIKFGIINIWGEPEMIDSYVALRMVRDLNCGRYLEGKSPTYFNEASKAHEEVRQHNFTQEIAADKMYTFAMNRNYWERRRVGIIKEEIPTFVIAANKGYAQ